MLTLKTQKDDKIHQFRISVILTTYNRRPTLELTLKAFEEQTFPWEYFEIIVVNDGSTDDTAEFLERYKNRGNLNFTYITKENEGQGIGRNTGFEHTDGEVILFAQDDIIPTPTFLQEHWKVHQRYFTENFICLGFTTWHQDQNITACMLFLEDVGMQFKYKALAQAKIMDHEYGLRLASHKFFYTSNISMKRSLFRRQHFDPRYKKYGWEDVELGFRLEKDERAIILYNPNAKAYHMHETDVPDMARRMEQVGKSAKASMKINKRLKIVPGVLKRVIFTLISVPPIFTLLEMNARKTPPTKENPLPFGLKIYYYALMKKHFLKGLAKK
ncbi:MAG: glycosyltransferase family 2 protein [Candidatus Gracilibacteria bacterium]